MGENIPIVLIVNNIFMQVSATVFFRKVRYQINSFKIEGLFGTKDVELIFDKSVHIYIGENGLGKTTILNALYYIIAQKFDELVNINFIRIEIAINRKKYRITKIDLKHYLEKNNVRRRTGVNSRLNKFLKDNDIVVLRKIIEKKDLSDLDKMTEVRKYIEGIGLKLSVSTQYLYDTINDIVVYRSQNTDIEQLSDVLNDLSLNLIYCPTYRRVEKDLKDLLEQIKKERPVFSFYDDDDDDDGIKKMSRMIHFGMSDVKDRIEEITRKIANISREKLDALSVDLLKREITGFPESKKLGKEEKATIKTILQRDQISLTEDEQGAVINMIENGDIYKPQNKQLLYLVTQLLNIYDSYSVYTKGIKGFVEVCNKYLFEKKFTYNEIELKLELKGTQTSEAIDLNCLSSGEKQIISMFSMVYLEPEKNFILLIDEPELSLSINWQKTLIPDIMDSHRCDFLFATTHSPFIFDNRYQDNTIGLNEFMENTKRNYG